MNSKMLPLSQEQEYSVNLSMGTTVLGTIDFLILTSCSVSRTGGEMTSP